MEPSDRNREDIKALTADVKAVTESVHLLGTNMSKSIHDLTVNMSKFADYKEDKAKFEARMYEISKLNTLNSKEISILIEKSKVDKENISVIRKEQKQAVGIVVSLLLAIIGKLLYPYFGA